MAATASQIYFRFQFWWCVTFNNVQIYSHTKFSQDSSIRGWDITISGFWKQTAAILKFYFRFHFDVSVIIGIGFSIDIPTYQILSKSHHRRLSYDAIAISKMAATASQIYIRFPLWWRTTIKTSKSICILNFNVAQTAAELLLFPVFDSKRPPYWNSTFGFHFDVFVVIDMWFCVGCRISSKSDHPRPSCDLIAIFKMAAVSHVGFAVG